MKYAGWSQGVRKEGLSDYISRAFQRAEEKAKGVFNKEPEVEEEFVWE